MCLTTNENPTPHRMPVIWQAQPHRLQFSTLANAFLTSYEQSSRLEDLEEVITYSHGAFTLCPDSSCHPDPSHPNFDSRTTVTHLHPFSTHPPLVSVPRHPFQTANSPFLPPPIFGATAATSRSSRSHETRVRVIVRVFP